MVVEEKPVSVKVNVSSRIMDIKAANFYLGLGGAYCDLCDHSRVECHDPEVIKAGFEITRSVADLHTVFEAVADEMGILSNTLMTQGNARKHEELQGKY